MHDNEPSIERSVFAYHDKLETSSIAAAWR